MNLVKCLDCKCQFNSKTGQSAKNAILIYNLIGVAIAVVIIYATAVK